MPRPAMISLALLMATLTTRGLSADDNLAGGFAHPPDAAKPWVYWWWLDSNASKEGITRDLEEMKRQGIGGALVFDAGLGGTSPVGPKFMSDAWRVDITDAVKPTGNELVITVANLWVNRLVRDSGLPTENRLTWTTHNPYKPNSPLLPSGLLGPVTVMAEDRTK